jgi:hypothetical protein
LPQNSVETRERNTSIILSRFFPTVEIDQLPRRVLCTYSDESLLAAVMRVLYPGPAGPPLRAGTAGCARISGGARRDAGWRRINGRTGSYTCPL